MDGPPVSSTDVIKTVPKGLLVKNKSHHDHRPANPLHGVRPEAHE